MDYKIRIIKYLYYFSLIGLLILYLFPGSIIGYFFLGDLKRQPDIIPNPMGTSINHLFAFFYLSIVGLFSTTKFSTFVYNSIFLIFVAIITELCHLIIPQRSFQYFDLFGNLIGTLLAIVIMLFYRRKKNGKI